MSREARTELSEIQSYFTELMRRRRDLSKDPAVIEQAQGLISARGRLSPAARLEIYREQYWLRHTSSLTEDFPGLSGILGQEAWQALAFDYLDAHPPRSFTLRDLGLELPRYVAQQTSLDHYELCLDMARLELAYLEVFDAPEPPLLDPTELAAIPEESWEHARIGIHPALRLLRVGYPVPALRRQLFEAQSSGENVPIPPREAQNLVIFRHDLQLFHEKLELGAFALLAALQQGVPLVAAAEQAQAEFPEEARSIEENAGAWFHAWAARGFICSVSI